MPDEHPASRYYCVGHGLGMSGEWPNIPHAEPGEGVKLEDQFLILSDGVERMSTYHFDERLSA